MSCDTAIEHLAATLSVRTVFHGVEKWLTEKWRWKMMLTPDVWALLCNPIFGFDFIYMYRRIRPGERGLRSGQTRQFHLSSCALKGIFFSLEIDDAFSLHLHYITHFVSPIPRALRIYTDKCSIENANMWF